MELKNEFKKQMENRMEHWAKKTVKIIAMILLGTLVFLLANYVLMSLWNWLMPDLFGLTTINFWQSLGLFAMAKLLFGFGGGGKHKGKSSHRNKMKSSNGCRTLRRDFNEWKHYDQFWKEEGENAFKEFVAKIKNENHA